MYITLSLEAPCETDAAGHCIYEGNYTDDYFFGEYQFESDVEGNFTIDIEYNE